MDLYQDGNYTFKRSSTVTKHLQGVANPSPSNYFMRKKLLLCLTRFPCLSCLDSSVNDEIQPWAHLMGGHLDGILPLNRSFMQILASPFFAHIFFLIEN